jgi:hypothetical protein
MSLYKNTLVTFVYKYDQEPSVHVATKLLVKFAYKLGTAKWKAKIFCLQTSLFHFHVTEMYTVP